MDDPFRGLADPIRRSILELLSRKPRGVSEIVSNFEVSRPAISRHLRRLRESELVSETRFGRERVYSIEPAGLDAVAKWVESVSGGAPPGEARKTTPRRTGQEARKDTSGEVARPSPRLVPEEEPAEIPEVKSEQDEHGWRQW